MISLKFALPLLVFHQAFQNVAARSEYPGHGQEEFLIKRLNEQISAAFDESDLCPFLYSELFTNPCRDNDPPLRLLPLLFPFPLSFYVIK